MNRTPPKEVIKILRKEIGFICPVKNCKNPFLTWHHFDPPWHKKEHHNPKGMIALCRIHHDQADNGAFTQQQLLEMKKTNKNKNIKGEFNWLRNKLLVNVGGNYFYDVMNVISIDNHPWIWFERDDNENLLLNFNMSSPINTQRGFIRQNTWYDSRNADDISCPPNGKLIDIKYQNGDRFKVKFLEISNGIEMHKKYPHAPTTVTGVEHPEIIKLRNEGQMIPVTEHMIDYPVTVVEITFSVPSIKFKVTPSNFSGMNIKHSLFKKCPSAINFKTSKNA